MAATVAVRRLVVVLPILPILRVHGLLVRGVLIYRDPSVLSLVLSLVLSILIILIILIIAMAHLSELLLGGICHDPVVPVHGLLTLPDEALQRV